MIMLMTAVWQHHNSSNHGHFRRAFQKANISVRGGGHVTGVVIICKQSVNDLSRTGVEQSPAGLTYDGQKWLFKWSGIPL